MTIAPPVDFTELERAAKDPAPTVCHLRDGGRVLCGALFAPAVDVEDAGPDPTASPCRGGCGLDRCAPCAAEYTLSNSDMT